MELEELRLHIRDWKMRTQGIAPPEHAVAVQPAASVAVADDEVVDIDAGPVPADDYDGGSQVAGGPYGYDETESIEDVAVDALPFGADGGTPTPVPSPDPEQARIAAQTASRLGVDLTVPEGESTAEIVVPGEDGFETED